MKIFMRRLRKGRIWMRSFFLGGGRLGWADSETEHNENGENIEHGRMKENKKNNNCSQYMKKSSKNTVYQGY